jgi:hypothetical protein
MRRMIIGSLFILIVISMSCEKKGWFVKCRDCTQEEPALAVLNVKLDDPQTPITINIYEGEIDDSVLYHTDEITWPEYTIEVPLNKKYTATATYNIDGSKYIAVDSAIPRVKYTEDQCDEPCYYVYDTDLNLRIKYTVKGN